MTPRREDDDGKTNVGVRIERTWVDLFRDSIKLAVILAAFCALLGLLATVQYVFCVRKDADATFVDCMRPTQKMGKLKR